MIRMAHIVPSAFAHLVVRVPVSRHHERSEAERVVNRYLYSGFVTGEVESDVSGEYWMVPVTYTDYRVPGSGTALEQAQGSVETQRDRLASGSFYTTEPTYFLPAEVTA